MGGGGTPSSPPCRCPWPITAAPARCARAARRSCVRAGQFETPPGSNSVMFGPEPMLDFELEFGVWLRGGNALGEPLGVPPRRRP